MYPLLFGLPLALPGVVGTGAKSSESRVPVVLNQPTVPV